MTEQIEAEMSEETAKQMFIDMFFWVAENRPEWLEEAIVRKKIELTSINQK
jgi:hypothetical protein